MLSPGAQLSMASVNKLATCWAWRSLGSLSAVVGAELGRAFGAVRVAGCVLEGALAAGATATVVVVLATLGPPEGRTGTNVVGGNVAVGAGRVPAFPGGPTVAGRAAVKQFSGHKSYGHGRDDRYHRQNRVL